MTPVILSGGSGTRLWPVSRQKWPKQFCPLFEKSLQTLTLERLQKFSTPWIVTSEELKTLTEIHLQDHKLQAHILLEPEGRNTAPAIAFICRHFELLNLSSEVIAILPADHLILKVDSFQATLEKAQDLAQKDLVVTLGIEPSYPETGYGYIQIENNQNDTSYPVVRFHEKPDLKTAHDFVQSGQYKWNAGIFVFKVQTMINLLKKHQPQIWETLKHYDSAQMGSQNLRSIYSKLESISIDYAIMEKLSPQILHCIPCDIGWSDVGSWDALADLQTQPSTEATISVESQNNYVHGLEGKNYSLLGVNHLIVVDTQDALLIAQKGQSQKIRKVVEQLKEQKDKRAIEHPFEQRPWGRFEILKDTENFKSKVIQVRPHSQLSYQSHQQREEHWIITRGQGEVVLNDQVIPVKAGTYVHIPLQAKHRMRNTGHEVLEFVEVQLGTYFGEDDIKRYQDDYNR